MMWVSPGLSLLCHNLPTSAAKGTPMSEQTTSSSQEIEGFVIQCADNESVQVSAKEASKLQEACEYFRNIFEHDTIESKTRTIEKKDWSSETTRCLIRLVTTGTLC
jgi:hypothetical protein